MTRPTEFRCRDPEAERILTLADSWGWSARKSAKGHIVLFKEGFGQTVAVSTKPSCPRASRNSLAELRRAERAFAQQQEQQEPETA